MTWVIAHRGASRHCPENTLAAFDAALEQGSDGLELDVQLSRDGVPVVYHDRTLSRAGGGRKRVAQFTLAELKRLDAGSRAAREFRGERIPTLEEVLLRYAGRTRLLVEIKVRGGEPRPELAQRTAELLERWRPRPQAFVLSFSHPVLAACAAAAPRLPRVLNLRPGRRLPAGLRRRLPSLHALSVDVRALTSTFAADVAGAGLPLFVYTCNTPATVHRAVLAGAAAVMSDRPAWLAERLRVEGSAP